jgi:hypothetical protein
MASEKKYFPERVRKIKTTDEVDDGEEPSEAQFTPLIQTSVEVKVTEQQ